MRRAVGKTENERTHLRMRGEQAPQRYAVRLAVEIGEPSVETFLGGLRRGKLRRRRDPRRKHALAQLIRRRCKCRHPAS